MRSLEAKDFLVSEIKQQAELENVPLEDPEIQMLYFTEQGGPSAKMQEIVADFESKYDSSTYEKKISRLMRNAYKRLKREHSTEAQTWDEAIRTPRKGDHYILVMWGGVSGLSFLLVLGLALPAIAAFIAFNWLGHKFSPPNPRVLQVAFVGFLVFGYLLRRQLAYALGVLVDKTVVRWLESRGEKNDL